MRVAESRLDAEVDRAEVARVQLAPGLGVELMRTSYQRQFFPKHTHEYFTIGLGLRGVGIIWFGGANHARRRGELVVIAPGDVHTGGPAPGSAMLSYFAIQVPATVLSLCADAHGIRRSNFSSVGSAVIHDSLIRAELSRLNALMNAATGGATIEPSSRSHPTSHVVDRLAEDVVVTALGLVVERYRQVGLPAAATRDEPELVRAVREIIDDCYADNVRTSLAMLSAECGVTPFHIVRSFTRSVGLSPHRYLVQVRVRRARELLARGVPPSWAATMTGFTDQSHLTLQFKRYVGMTPGSYQRCLSQCSRRAG
jgi:AraC-like DNA-binding protein/quercetin dioxygenase-like cupin family protein